MISLDKYINENMTIMNTVDIPLRTNKDLILDSNGIFTLDICQVTGLLIV